MIELHRLSHGREPFHLNPDLIERVEASPDCHVSLTTGTRIAVAESVPDVVRLVRDYRVDILTRGLKLAR
jgi:flagellar protein FlbD